MAGRAVKLTEGAARKTAETVHRVLNGSEDRTEPPAQSFPAMPFGFWAEITGEPSDGVYSWKRLRPQKNDTSTSDPEDPLRDTDPLLEGTENAQEIDQTAGIANETRVWMQPNGVDSDGKPQFIFKHSEAETTFHALITGHASLATNRWKYAWSEAEWNGDDLQVKSGGRSGTTGGSYAVNRAENYHGSQYAYGVDMNLTSYSDTGFAPRPVGAMGSTNTHDKDIPATIHVEKDVNGDTVHWFDLIWAHQGSCSSS